MTRGGGNGIGRQTRIRGPEAMALELTFAKGAMLVVGTGSVGSGVAKLAGRAGVPLIVTYTQNAARADALVRAITVAGGRAQSARVNLADMQSLQGAIALAEAFGGGLAHVVSAGGPMVPFGRLADLTPGVLRDFVTGDALGVVNLAVAAIPALRRNGGGSFTVCTTVASRRIVKFDGASPVSKGAVEALIRQLASEEAPNKIRCNAVAVSWVSELSAAEQRVDLSGLPEPDLSYVNVILDQMEHETPLGRPALSEECAWLFAFLASEQARYITGVSIPFDGGFSLGPTPSL